MSPITPGAIAPDFSLKQLDGQNFSLTSTLQSTPVVAAFFKVSCPTCQYAFPFLERIHKSYPTDKARLVGVSQDDAEATKTFVKEFGVSFPVVLDGAGYPASNAFRLENVPSLFSISTAGKVELTAIGWVKSEIEAINQRMAKAAGLPPAQIFKPGEYVADFKAG